MLFAFLKLDNNALFNSLRNYGFKAVSDENWQKLLKGIELLASNQWAHFKIREEIKHLREEAAKSSCADSANAMLQLSRWVAPAYLTWQKKRIALFNNPAWWEKRLLAAKRLEQPERDKAHQTIPFLRKLWEQQNHYAFYSTLDLINVYETIFPLFDEWLLYAKTELKKKSPRLLKEVFNQYEQYLKNVEKSIAHEKQQVRMALKVRLVAGLAQQNFQCDEVMDWMQAELQAVGVLPVKKSSPNQDTSGYITPPVSWKMQQIVEQEGGESEKGDWYSLSYNAHRNPTHLLFYEHYRLAHQGHTYRIPAELTEYIPIALPFYLQLPRFLHWLFITERFYYTFFQHPTCQYLLGMEQSFEQWKCPPGISLATLEKNPSWQGLQNLWSHLDAEKTRIEQIQKRLFIFVRRDIGPLLESYHQHLETFANEIVMRQMALINEALKPFDQKSLTDHEKQQLEQFLQQVQQTETRWKRTGHVKLASSHLILHCHHLLNRPVVTTEKLAVATRAVEALNQEKPVTAEAFDAIKTTQNSLALSECVTEADSYTKAQFTMEMHLAKEKVPDLLTVKLLENPLNQDQDALTRHLQALKTYHPWVLREKPPLIDPVVLNDQLSHYAYRFLQSIHELPSQATFLEKNSVIKQVIGTLQYLTETTFPALHRTLTSVAKMNIHQPLYVDDWELFRQCELLPPLNTLRKYLTERGLEHHLPHKTEIKSQSESENAHTFKKVFSSVEKLPSSQTNTTSFNPTLTQ